ncbi:BOI-related E3 ubiquitin-protein ligase 1-like [Quercus lobata]|uniref:RING-type domain-containing protein n=1 Tax=Quercus lobata TaxID=97700 RepID=A0A7N2MV37_QUELO|nr:BOI-related E3 ubiquitin-protein ligase 1-like [Quercus lobata]
MAVEARHMNLFQSKFITNRDFVKLNQGNPNMYNTQMDSMLPQVAAMPETLPPYYQSVDCGNLGGSTKTFMNKADSGLTYAIPVPDQRKRPRDSINDFNALPIRQKTNKVSGLPSFLDQDFILRAHQQQLEIDRFLAQHAEKVRLEIGEQEERQSRMLESVFQEAIMNKLKEKDEEIQRMGKLNWVLQERVKSLSIENQIWRELAQTNEATANTLRSNLEQVLAHVAEDRHVAATADDAESSCGSNDFGRCTPPPLNDGGDEAVGSGGNRMCKNCGVGESRVLLLPCRHLCLCTNCGSTLRTCPVCHSVMTASVNVNLS